MALLSHFLYYAQYLFRELSSAAARHAGYATIQPYSAMKCAARTYSLSIEHHPDGYLAYFPALAGCSTWGRTFEEAVKNAEEALALYLEALDELGQPAPHDHIDEPISIGITVRTCVVA